MMYENSMLKDMVMMGPFMWVLILLGWSLVPIGLIGAGRWLIAQTGHTAKKRNSIVNDDQSHDA